MKNNKTNTHVNTYPSPNKTINKVDLKVNSTLIHQNIWILQSNKDLKNLKNNDTLCQKDRKYLVAKNLQKY